MVNWGALISTPFFWLNVKILLKLVFIVAYSKTRYIFAPSNNNK